MRAGQRQDSGTTTSAVLRNGFDPSTIEKTPAAQAAARRRKSRPAGGPNTGIGESATRRGGPALG